MNATPDKLSRMTKYHIFIRFNKARWAVKKSNRDDKIKMLQRLYKALGILQHKDYYQAERAAYEPTRYSCKCKDWEFKHSKKRAYTGPCKHMLAEAMLDMKLEYRQTSFI